MSRVGKVPITVPPGVTIVPAGGRVDVRGPKGIVTVPVHAHVTVTEDAGVLHVTVVHPTQKNDRALWGLTARLLQNACTGVTKGFERTLEIHGVGFRAEVRGSTIELALGYSHPVTFPLPDGTTASVEKNVVTIRGADRQVVGETAARMRRLRQPDAYHGKGIRYGGEQLKLKPGKAAKTGTAAK